MFYISHVVNHSFHLAGFVYVPDKVFILIYLCVLFCFVKRCFVIIKNSFQKLFFARNSLLADWQLRWLLASQF
jgi:lipid-A-disaccharide synthase-like uncharacterized protein